MEKEFGRLSLEQFQRLIKQLPEVRGEMVELSSLIKSASPKKLVELFGDGFHWAVVYELAFIETITFLFVVFGRVQKLLEIAQATDPQEELMKWGDTEELADWGGGEGGLFGEKAIVGLTVVMQRNILSIMLFHRTLCALVEEVRQGVDESLFLAVRVDRSIVACPTFANRIARAELENDKPFFLRLRSALKGPSKKHWEAYRDLRYALFLLRELGFDQMSDAQLEDLLVHKLKLYSPSAGARKNLRKQFAQSKKFSTT
jgi:hypothetical protein